MMYVICGIHPGGNIRPGSLLFKVRNSASATTTPGAISTTIGTANASANESADELEISVNNNLKNLNFTNPPIMAKSEEVGYYLQMMLNIVIVFVVEL
ncbi:unnamed protein product [[Candida] boidinii]|nr:unnamed protein product [[Candida] boidinii]